MGFKYGELSGKSSTFIWFSNWIWTLPTNCKISTDIWGFHGQNWILTEYFNMTWLLIIQNYNSLMLKYLINMLDWSCKSSELNPNKNLWNILNNPLGWTNCTTEEHMITNINYITVGPQWWSQEYVHCLRLDLSNRSFLLIHVTYPCIKRHRFSEKEWRLTLILYTVYINNTILKSCSNTCSNKTWSKLS